MNLNFVISLIFILLSNVSSLFFILEPFEQRCIYRQLNANTLFSGTFFFSGENEEANRVQIKNDNGIILWQALSSKHGDFNVQISNEGL